MADIAGFEILIYFFENVDILLLIFVRCLGFLVAVPIFSGQNMFMQARIFFALCLAVSLFMSGMVSTVYIANDTTLGYVYMILLEFLVGMAMGYVVLAVFSLIFFAGQIMDFSIGLMMVNAVDPMTQMQVPVTGNIFYMGLMALLVATGGMHALFLTFFQSYEILPIGTAFVIGNQPLAWYIVYLLVESTILAVRLAMPILGSMMLVTIALGITVKTVPQLNVFVVGLPLRLLIGSIMLFMVMIPNLGAMFGHIFNMAHLAMWEVIWGMRPL